jgi:hypothetical protein
MSKEIKTIDAKLSKWIQKQKIFFVATAPLTENGHINCSPKGLDSFRILNEHTVAYQDLVGSGAETIAHIRENKRIVIMFKQRRGVRSYIRIQLTRIADSCGYSVPLYEFKSDRDVLDKWVDSKSDDGVKDYIRKNNAKSIDGLDALDV